MVMSKQAAENKLYQIKNKSWSISFSWHKNQKWSQALRKDLHPAMVQVWETMVCKNLHFQAQTVL